MLSLYLLALLVGYHGGVLWLALRFRGRPWRWYWFVLVLVLGWGWAWWDRLFIYQVVQKDWCQRPEVGFHELAPVHITGKEVTWLTPARRPNGEIIWRKFEPESQQLIDKKEYVTNRNIEIVSNLFTCVSPTVKYESSYCVVRGYRTRYEREDVRVLGRHVATKWRSRLLRGEEVLRESVIYYWGGATFFPVPLFGSNGECGELGWDKAEHIDIKE